VIAILLVLVVATQLTVVAQLMAVAGTELWLAQVAPPLLVPSIPAGRTAKQVVEPGQLTPR
jgi:hypothetical protein